MVGEHPNIAMIRRAYEVWSEDLEASREFIADDIVWHVPGRGRFAGDVRGIDELFAFFRDVAGEPGTTSFSFDIRDMLASEERVAASLHYHHERGADVFDQDGVELFRISADGKIAEFWAFLRDTRAFDEFFG
jgi:hypothetical protein